MGPGHLGLGFAAKSAAFKMPLWSLLIATELLDLLSFGFRKLGFESFGVSQTDLQHGLQVIQPAHIPLSHGLFMSVKWSLLAGLIAYLIFKDRRLSSITGLLVFSHWFLDFIVHLADLPLFFNSSPVLGLGLWGSGPGIMLSIVLEILLLVVGVVVYAQSRKRLKQGTSG